MARKGQLVSMGDGSKRTNPIHENDLARFCISHLHQSNSVLEAGGKEILTRKEILEIIQSATSKGKKIRKVPIGLLKIMLPLMRPFNRNMYDKMAFFLEVMQHDTIAPMIGASVLEDYIRKAVR
jgi:uncharacterized protein YbjT (DUF2867 family)